MRKITIEDGDVENRRGFITSALKATAAGLLVPEHLWRRSMISGFHSRIVTTGIGFPAAYGPIFDEALSLLLVALSDTYQYVSPIVVIPNRVKAFAVESDSATRPCFTPPLSGFGDDGEAERSL